MELQRIDGVYEVLKFPTTYAISEGFQAIEGFKSVTYTSEECSVVVAEGGLSSEAAVATDKGWQIIKIVGELDFSLIGILTQLANPLAENGISIFALSTYNTDYLLIKADKAEQAVAVLTEAGHQFI